MEKYIVKGGKKLSGEIEIQGSKNSAVAVLFATLVTEGISEIHNLPEITDVLDCFKILTILNCGVKYENKIAEIDTRTAKYAEIPGEFLKNMRASSYLIGSMLSRFGKCPEIKSGGCMLGKRPLDLHYKAAKTLGTEIVTGNNGETLSAPAGLYGGEIVFPFKSVGATVNALLLASRANGKTVIKNAAKEPHIRDTAEFLRSCGAEIIGDGSDEITVLGSPENLHGGKITLESDMIEAGTFMILGAFPTNEIICKNVPVKDLASLFALFDRGGINYKINGKQVEVYGGNVRPDNIVTGPFPEFPTDLQPLCAVLLSLCDGKSVIKESVYASDRFAYAAMLGKMGLKYDVIGNELNIYGKTVYSGASVKSTDLRGGASLVMASTLSGGVSVISDVRHIERGYSHFVKKMRSLGADIETI